jgi:hypothetical protein
MNIGVTVINYDSADVLRGCFTPSDGDYTNVKAILPSFISNIEFSFLVAKVQFLILFQSLNLSQRR